MSIRTGIGIALIWVLSLFAVGSVVSAQLPELKPVPPKVIAGSDLGFRVEATQGNKVIGQVVVKVNGEWVEAVIGSARPVNPLK